MLTLVRTNDAVPLVSIFERSTKKNAGAHKKKKLGTVYFTHESDPEKSNVSDASGVLTLHKTFLKKENHINDYEFDEITTMLDADEEPDAHHPLKHVYWSIRQNFDRYLQREMFIGDVPEYIPTRREDCRNRHHHRQFRCWKNSVFDGHAAALPQEHARPHQAADLLAFPGTGYRQND